MVSMLAFLCRSNRGCTKRILKGLKFSNANQVRRREFDVVWYSWSTFKIPRTPPLPCAPFAFEFAPARPEFATMDAVHAMATAGHPLMEEASLKPYLLWATSAEAPLEVYGVSSPSPSSSTTPTPAPAPESEAEAEAEAEAETETEAEAHAELARLLEATNESGNPLMADRTFCSASSLDSDILDRSRGFWAQRTEPEVSSANHSMSRDCGGAADLETSRGGAQAEEKDEECASIQRSVVSDKLNTSNLAPWAPSASAAAEEPVEVENARSLIRSAQKSFTSTNSAFNRLCASGVAESEKADKNETTVEECLKPLPVNEMSNRSVKEKSRTPRFLRDEGSASQQDVRDGAAPSSAESEDRREASNTVHVSTKGDSALQLSSLLKEGRVEIHIFVHHTDSAADKENLEPQDAINMRSCSHEKVETQKQTVEEIIDVPPGNDCNEEQILRERGSGSEGDSFVTAELLGGSEEQKESSQTREDESEELDPRIESQGSGDRNDTSPADDLDKSLATRAIENALKLKASVVQLRNANGEHGKDAFTEARKLLRSLGARSSSPETRAPAEGGSPSSTVATVARGVYFKGSIVPFGDRAVGGLYTAKIDLCNSSKRAVIVKFEQPEVPFLILHKKVRLRPRSYVMLPIRFRPHREGFFCATFRASWKFETEDSSEQLSQGNPVQLELPLQGTAIIKASQPSPVTGSERFSVGEEPGLGGDESAEGNEQAVGRSGTPSPSGIPPPPTSWQKRKPDREPESETPLPWRSRVYGDSPDSPKCIM